MLALTIPSKELYDEVNNEFITIREQVLQLEHSLVSLSKWESKWGKPFLSQEKKTYEESVDYIKCMTLTQNVSVVTYLAITNDMINQVSRYIEAPMTATILPKSEKTTRKEIVTAELIYYWMIALSVPFECQKWHLNRLLTLINVCSLKNEPSKPMTRQDLMNRRNLNEARRKASNTRG